MLPVFKLLLRSLLVFGFVLTACNAIAQNTDETRTSIYSVRHQSLDRVLEIFQPLVANTPEVRVRHNAQPPQITLSGPTWAHELLQKVLQRLDRPAKGSSSGSNAASQGSRPAPENPALGAPVTADPKRSAMRPTARRGNAEEVEARRQLISLPRGRGAELRRAFFAVMGDRVKPASTSDGPAVLATEYGPLKIEFNVRRADVLLDGPVPVIQQFDRLLQALVVQEGSGPPPSRAASPNLAARVMTLSRQVQPPVQQALASCQGATLQRPGQPLPAATAGDQQAPAHVILKLVGTQQAPRSEPPPAQDADDNPQADRQSPQAAGDPPTGPGTLQAPPSAVVPDDAPLPQLDGVEVELLPDLDAIILKGRDQDLSQLAEIIRELERLSRETQPAIEIIPLQHTGAVQIEQLITESQTELLSTQQGRAQLIPLGKPNALVLIGWGEAVTTLRSLIEKLDQPVPAESQFELFRLRFARAETLQETIEEFLTGRDGELSPDLETTVDARTNTLIVHASPRDMAEVRALVQRLDTQAGNMVQRTRVFQINHSLAADVAETLQQTIDAGSDTEQAAAMELILGDDGEMVVSGIMENIRITPNVRKNTLIISAPAENFRVIEELINQLDSPGMTAKIKIFSIENSDAASLVETLRSLLPSQAGTDAAAAQLSSAPGESSLAPLRFTVDVRSNSIIATGSDGDLGIVDALITRLDEADQMQRENTVYQLKNSPAVDVALAINEFLRNSRQVEEANPGAVNPYEQLEKEVVVVPEPVSNKLIVSATPRYFKEISEMIESLDAQPPQVMIQALIAEVDLDNTEEFGVELGVQDSVLFDRSLLGDLLTLTNTEQSSTPSGILTSTTQEIIAATNQPGFNFNSTQDLGNSASGRALSGAGNVGGQGISNFDVGRGNAELGFGGLVLSASSQNINVLLRALEETRRLDILSRPQVLTLDNQPAFIQVGQRVPRITGSTISQVGQVNNVELENVGLILGVTPRISPEGKVTMEIDAEKSNIGPETEGIPVSVSNDGTIIRSPRVDVTSAQATVSAADGETIILGGLITKSRRQVNRKVPYLGDLPLLRHLFRFDSLTTQRTELLIILTPHIIRTPADAERLKQVEMARMSWCAADVFDLHGEVYMTNDASVMLQGENHDVPVIYPATDPRAQSLFDTETETPATGPEDSPATINPPVQTVPTGPRSDGPRSDAAPDLTPEPISTPEPTLMRAPEPIIPSSRSPRSGGQGLPLGEAQ